MFNRLRRARPEASRLTHTHAHPAGHDRQDEPGDRELGEDAVEPLHTFPLRQSHTEQSAISRFDVPVRTGPSAALENREKDRLRDRRADPLGLTVLYEPEGSLSADIIFIHGLGGSSYQTWSKNRDPALFWPLEWLPHEPGLTSARISTFGYNAHFAQASSQGSILDISDFAKELLFNLRFARGAGEHRLEIGNVPIVLVTHSMGGLVAKQACILGQNDVHYKDIIRSVTAIVFLSTPHRGTDLAKTLNRILSACIFTFSPRLYIEELRRNSPTLQSINDQFRHLTKSIKIASFFETRPTKVGLLRLLILQRDSSTLGYPDEITNPLDADHHGVCKYTHQQDPNYTSVRDVLRDLVEKFPPKSAHQSTENSLEDLERIAAFLGDPELPIDDHEFFSDKRLDGSCKWVLDDSSFLAWLNDDALGGHILWCTGKPGSGKSVTTSFLITYMEELQLKYGFYFFRFGDQVKNTLTAFLLSVAFQIGSVVPEYRRRLVRLSEDGLNIQQATPRLIWKKLFVSALLKLEVKQPIYIVVDALDETESAPLLLKFMSDLSACSASLRFLLVSRAIPLLVRSFERLSKTVKLSQTTFDNSDEDLKRYVNEEMQLMHGDTYFKGQIIERILAKAAGNFLWVHLVVNQILDCHTEDDVEEALNEVPQELGPLYERMDAELGGRSTPGDRKLGLAILRWASCSRHPLTLSELAQALHPEYPRVLDLKHTVRQVCGEFVIIDKKEHITIIHSSAKEYLTRNEHLNYYVNMAVAHQVLFIKCINNLTHTSIKLQPGQTRDKSFGLYAASSWPFHLDRSDESIDQDNLLALASFFRTSSVLSWIYTLSAHGRLRILIQASKSIIDFGRMSDKFENDRNQLTYRLEEKEILALWAQDLTRIVGKFGIQLVRHPKTIYKLIPALCPRQSIVHRQFASRSLSPSLMVSGVQKPYWDDCLAKFATPNQTMPVKIMTLDHYFAILDDEGRVRLHYSSTCEEAREFKHGERVLTWCFSATGERMATYSLLSTKIWDISSGRLRGSIQNHEKTKALAICFAENDEMVVICSDDREIRACQIGTLEDGWSLVGGVIGIEFIHGHPVNSPQRALFSPDGSLIAVSYRGLPLSVWSLIEPSPRPIGRCERSGDRLAANPHVRTNFTDAQTFCWNPMTGHILGVFNDGCVFRWSPFDNDYMISKIRATNVECSADGKFFVTTSSNGTLRVWDFYHFSPVYQLSYDISVTDLAIDRNEARIYDLRDKFCNVWEPHALLRFLDSEDRASDGGSSKESSMHALLVSNSSAEELDPVTALCVNARGSIYAVGNDEGVLSLYSISGARFTRLSQSFMTIQQISWNADGDIVASSDLSRKILVQNLLDTGPNNMAPTVNTIFKIHQNDPVSQLLLSPKGNYLLVQTPSSAKAYSLDMKSELHPLSIGDDVRWVNNPSRADALIGFGHESITICGWTAIERPCQIKIQRKALDPDFKSLSGDLMNRRPSTTYLMAPSEIEIKITKALLPVEGSLVLIETSYATSQSKRSKQYMMIDLRSLRHDQEECPAKPLPIELLADLEVPLGFVAARTLNAGNHRKSSACSSSIAAVPQLTSPADEQVLAFISKDFWICTYALCEGFSGRVRRYFFLPRDWLNKEWLELATVTAYGKVLCPRNGDIAIINDWMHEEWTE